ncbi:MAG: hypothetical protein P1U77_28945 [Rubripirellula sp.]|nr:hypothetical protein [Rubripirellula sp.]
MTNCSTKPWQLLADPFSWEGWRHEGAQRVFPPMGIKGIRRTLQWQTRIRFPPADKIDFLLIESAWELFRRRHDRYSVPIELANAYRKAGIPVIYWNKEDPICFDEFHQCALACDVILTTDSGSIAKYRDAGFKGVIEVLTFPVQPRIHKQYLPKDPERKLFFAGTYRDKYETRRETYRTLIRPSLDLGLEIFSRRGRWPDECENHIVGSHDYLTLLKAYSPYLMGLNMSSIKDSPTMFPRRVVEMIMGNVLVISDECQAVAELFPEIPRSGSAQRTRDLVEHFLQNDVERNAIIAAVQTRILKSSTYELQTQRLRELANRVRNH